MLSHADASPTHEPGEGHWRGGPYRALNHTFELCTNARDTFQPRLERQLAPLRCTELTTAEHVYRIEDRAEPLSGRYAVFDNDTLVTTSPSRFVAAGTIHWLANQGAVTSADTGVVQLHAGGVQRGGATLALPAPMDSGKSTTIAGLIRRGYGYLTDEIVELMPGGQIQRSYPKALSLDRSSVDLLGGMPEPFSGAAREPQWHVPASWLGAPAELTLPTTLAAIIFPIYTPGSPARVLPMSPGEAVVLLMESTFRFPDRSAACLPVLTDLAEQVPAFRLLIDDLDEGVTAVTTLADDLTRRQH